MIQWLKNLFTKKPIQPKHRHDYEMVFRDDGLSYDLVCSCGDRANDMWDAMKKMSRS